jgi:hypothetical protein
MELNQLVDQDRKTTGWVTFKPGFDVALEFVPLKTLETIRKNCTKTVYKRHQPVEVTDEDRLNKEIANYIVDWKGFDGAMLKTLFPIKIDADIPDGEEIPCDAKNKLYMLTNCYGFGDFVINNLTEYDALRKEQFEKELKNSDALSHSA